MVLLGFIVYHVDSSGNHVNSNNNILVVSVREGYSVVDRFEYICVKEGVCDREGQSVKSQ